MGGVGGLPQTHPGVVAVVAFRVQNIEQPGGFLLVHDASQRADLDRLQMTLGEFNI